MVTTKARKQRKRLFNLPNHRRRKEISSHLSPELREKYGFRSLPVRVGDTVEVVRGDKSILGFEGKVSTIFTKERKIALEGLTQSKADEKQVSRKLHPSNVIITKLDLSDKKRREKLEKHKEE